MKNWYRHCLSEILFASDSYNSDKLIIEQINTFVASKAKPNVTANLIETFTDLINKIRNTCDNPFINYYFDAVYHVLRIKTLNTTYIVMYRNSTQFAQADIVKYLFNVNEKYEGCTFYLLSNTTTDEQRQIVTDCFQDMIHDDTNGDKLCNAIKNEKIFENGKGKDVYMVSQILESYCSINTVWFTYYLFFWFISNFKCFIYSCNKQFEAWDDRFESEYVIQKERNRFRESKNMVTIYNSMCSKNNKYSKHVKGYFDHFDTYDNKLLIVHDAHNSSMLYTDNYHAKWCNLPVMQCLFLSKSYTQEYEVLTIYQKIKFIIYSNVVSCAFILMLLC